MKQYEKPEIIAYSLIEDVMAPSKLMDAFDDMETWGDGWSSNAGGNV